LDVTLSNVLNSANFKTLQLPYLVESNVSEDEFHKLESAIWGGLRLEENGNFFIDELPSARHSKTVAKIKEEIRDTAIDVVGKGNSGLEDCTDVDIKVSYKGQSHFVPDGALQPENTRQATIVIEHAVSESLEHVMKKVAGYFAGATATTVQEVIAIKTWSLPAGLAMLALRYTRTKFNKAATPDAGLQSPKQAIQFGPQACPATETNKITTVITGAGGGCAAAGNAVYELNIPSDHVYHGGAKPVGLDAALPLVNGKRCFVIDLFVVQQVIINN